VFGVFLRDFAEEEVETAFLDLQFVDRQVLLLAQAEDLGPEFVGLALGRGDPGIETLVVRGEDPDRGDGTEFLDFRLDSTAGESGRAQNDGPGVGGACLEFRGRAVGDNPAPVDDPPPRGCGWRKGSPWSRPCGG
jgi:hypothetical protein